MSEEDDRIALVTGANKGIGLGIARRLGARGITILVGARDRNRGQAAAEGLRKEGAAAHPVLLDVTRPGTVEAAAAWIESTYGKLDILVNNAGVSLEHPVRPPSETPLDVVRKTYETNVFGVITVTNAMLPLLRKSPAGRIVNLASAMGSLGVWSDGESSMARFAPVILGYNSSKTALNALTVMYARELADSPIKVNSVSPGYIATDLNGHRGTGTIDQGAEEPARLALLPADGPTGRFFSEDDSPLPWWGQPGSPRRPTCAALDLAPFNIRVNAVGSGMVGTPVGYREHAHRPQINPRIPAGHVGTPEDVAEAVAFLVSERASYIYGAVLPLDGGLNVGS